MGGPELRLLLLIIVAVVIAGLILLGVVARYGKGK